MDDLEACRICLKTSCRLFGIRALGLGATLAQLLGAPWDAPALPRALCAVCAVQLRHSRQLAARARAAHILLLQVLETKRKISLDDVREIDSVSSTLLSREFATTHFTPNHCDLHISIGSQSTDFTLAFAKLGEVEGLGALKDDTLDEVIKSEVTEITENVDPVDDNDVLKSEMTDGGDTDCMESSDNEDETKQRSLHTSINVLHINDTVKKEIEVKTSPKREVKKGKKKGSKNNTKKLNEHFKVQKLSLEEQKLQLEKVKLKANYLRSPYKCETCYKGFKEEANLTAHLVKHSENSGPEECPVCHIRFPSRNACGHHVALHTTIYSCRACQFQTQSRKDAIRHIDWHQGTVYRCDLCTNAVFEFSTSLVRHRRIHHPSQMYCPLCGTGISSETKLKVHYQWKHPGHAMTELPPGDGPRCRQCELTFATEAALAKHHRLQHGESKYKLHVGAAQENNTNEFVCDDARCGEAFSAAHLLRGHVWRAHGRGPPARPGPRPRGTAGPRAAPLSVQCHVCGKLFHCAATLRYHVEEHEGSVSHACPDCGKGFGSRARMRLHWRQHTLRHACPVCQRVFNSASNRDRHQKSVHATARDCPCRYCEKAFTSQRLRQQHEVHVHMQKEWPKRARGVRRKDPGRPSPGRSKAQDSATPKPEGAQDAATRKPEQ